MVCFASGRAKQVRARAAAFAALARDWATFSTSRLLAVLLRFASSADDVNVKIRVAPSGELTFRPVDAGTQALLLFVISKEVMARNANYFLGTVWQRPISDRPPSPSVKCAE